MKRILTDDMIGFYVGILFTNFGISCLLIKINNLYFVLMMIIRIQAALIVAIFFYYKLIEFYRLNKQLYFWLNPILSIPILTLYFKSYYPELIIPFVCIIMSQSLFVHIVVIEKSKVLWKNFTLSIILAGIGLFLGIYFRMLFDSTIVS
jgi:hypothetical protein